jgi:uncharacterized membrane protein YdfJ with MMPL/SSD domain
MRLEGLCLLFEFMQRARLLSELGLTISSAVVPDVVVNILFSVPAVMAIASKYNWWPARKQASTVEAVAVEGD